MNFQLPQQDDDFDCYGNSSQDESRGSQGRHFDSSKFSMFFFFQSLFCWFAFSLTNLDFVYIRHVSILIFKYRDSVCCFQ